MVGIKNAEEIRITFGMIVLNGEPFTRYNLRSLYPFAHQIIVVEGACTAAKNIATADGHSRDATLETLRRFKAEEDPDNKLIIVTAEDEGHPDGFWPGEKHEMSQAYAKRATGNYLWQVDSDEFYRDEDMRYVINWLGSNPSITAVTIKTISFWGSTDCVVDGFYLMNGASSYHRLFKWEPGYVYSTHRPPTVVNSAGVDLRLINWQNSRVLEKQGIYLYHYSLLFPKQVQEKCDYYGNVDWTSRDRAQRWANDIFLDLKKPFRVHNVYEHLSWLDKYSGPHPNAVVEMMNDISSGLLDCDLRDNTDVNALLNRNSYRLGKYLLSHVAYIMSSKPGLVVNRLWYVMFSRLPLIRDPKRLMQGISRRYKAIVNKHPDCTSK